jgi:hypothetical protein
VSSDTGLVGDREPKLTMNLHQHFKILNQSFSILSKWIIPRLSISLTDQERYTKYTKYWEDKIISYISKNGLDWTCKRAKLIRSITISKLAGTPITYNEEIIGIDKQGFPKALGPLRALFANPDDVVAVKFGLTLLTSTKIIKLPPRPNYNSIIDPCKGNIGDDWDIYVNRYFRSLHVRKHSLKCEWSEYHLSTKTSPSGGLAMADSLKEALSLKDKVSIIEAIFCLGGKRLTKYLSLLITNLEPRYDTKAEIRKVSPISDKEGKTRVIALFDYWSQTALKPLHHSLLGLLRSLPSDMTFNQDAFTKDLKSGPYFSFDLKDATDRFPIALQQKVLSYLIGEDKAKAWSTILTHHDFVSPEGNRVRYSTGQPMGAYSSWAAFAVTHHFVVARAAMETQKFPFSNYYLLGDDIVICDPVVAQKYEELMVGLGIEFSKTKTFKSKILFEFASRIFLYNKEVSPFSLAGVEESINSPAQTVEFLKTMERHGWNLLREGHVPGQIRSFMRLAGSPAFTRWTALLDVLYHLPLMEVVNGKVNSPRGGFLLSQLSCFENQHVPLIRNALIVELRSRVEESIDRITTLHTDWAITLPKSSEYIRSATGDVPMAPGIIPFIGVWHTLKRKAREMANDLASYYYEIEEDFPLSKWLDDLVSINNTPNVNQALKERKYKELTLTASSLIFKAFNKVLKEGITIED